MTIKGKLVYLSGAIDGTPNCKELFSQAAVEVMNRWHTPVNPLDIPPWNHPWECPEGYSEGNGHSSACWIRSDLAVLLQCEAVLRLPNWEFSRGARLESDVALFSGIPLYDLDAHPESKYYLRRGIYFHNKNALALQAGHRERWTQMNNAEAFLQAALEKNNGAE